MPPNVNVNFEIATRGGQCQRYVTSLVVLLRPTESVMSESILRDGTYGFSSLSEKTRKSNHLQMSEQRQHFLLSYLKTLSVGPAGNRTQAYRFTVWYPTN